MEKITTLSEYLEIIESYEAALEEKDEENRTLYFRGETKTGRELQPSIFRSKELLKVEDKLFLDMQRFMYKELKDFHTTLDKLVFMQHHGLPTRLLDITANPLVSLYFACEKYHNENDGIVYILPQYDKVDSERASVASLLSKLDVKFERDELKKFIWEELNVNLSDVIIDDYLNSNEIFIKTNRNNNRQINQDGDFLLFSNNLRKNEKDEKKSFHLESEKMEFSPIIVHKDKKQNILRELNRIGINLFTLFPEADKLSMYLVNKHARTNKKEELHSQDKVSQIIDFMRAQNINNEEIIAFIKENDIFEEETKEEFILLGYEKIGIFDTDKIERFIDNLG